MRLKEKELVAGFDKECWRKKKGESFYITSLRIDTCDAKTAQAVCSGARAKLRSFGLVLVAITVDNLAACLRGVEDFVEQQAPDVVLMKCGRHSLQLSARDLMLVSPLSDAISLLEKYEAHFRNLDAKKKPRESQQA